MPYQRFLTFCLLLTVAFASPIASPIEMGKHTVNDFHVLIDAQHNYSPTTALKATQWQSIKANTLNLGYTNATVWVMFELSNNQDTDLIRLLDFNYPLLDNISVYKVHGEGVEDILHTGDNYRFSNRQFAHPNFISTITLPAQSTQRYLAKIKTNSPVQTQAIVWDIDHFQKYYRDSNGMQFLYIGLILSVALLNLLIYLYLKESVYLTYAGYAASLGLLITSQSAVLFEYVYPESPEFHRWSQLILAAAAVMLTALFSFKFLKFEQTNRIRNLFMGLFSLPLLVLIASPFSGYQSAIQMMVITGLIVVPSCFLIGLFVAKKSADRNIFLLAWSFLILGACTFLLSKLGLLPFNAVTNNAIQIGSTLELLTFSIALARRIYMERESRLKAKQIVIDSNQQTAQLQASMLFTATHDAITELPNRNKFDTFLQSELNHNKHGVLVVCHLERLEVIDKTLGRELSNLALKDFSIRLNKTLRATSMALPISAKNQFYAATLSASTHGFILAPDHRSIESTLYKLKLLIDHPVEINGMELELNIQFAYITYPEFGRNSDKLLRKVGVALDAAQDNPDHIIAYNRDIDPYNGRRLVLMGELKRAISESSLMLHYQPLVDTRTQKIIAAEALIRWPHKEYGLIMPDEFIQMAEQSGIIQALSLWVINTGLSSLNKWHKRHPQLSLSVNISAFNLQDDKFIEALHLILQDRTTLCQFLVLEITETQMMSDTKHALKNLWSLSELGVQIAIDDFGTGYSSLAYLKKLPANELKIDKAFILGLESDPQNQVLVKTAIHMAHDLGMKVVAEGVESEHTRVVLEELNCDICQGYHFGRPTNEAAFTKLLSEEVEIKPINDA